MHVACVQQYGLSPIKPDALRFTGRCSMRAKIIRLKEVTNVNLYKPTVHALNMFIRR